jgi:hypothetical protein
LFQLTDVGAGNKSAARAKEHDRLDFGVRTRLFERNCDRL